MGTDLYLRLATNVVVDSFNSRADVTDKNGKITEDILICGWTMKGCTCHEQELHPPRDQSSGRLVFLPESEEAKKAHSWIDNHNYGLAGVST